jgi:para-nitrobenzyl esterase
VQGSLVATRRSFQGIPFAAPPVGALRWKPPQRAADWTGVRDATKPGPSCIQSAPSVPPLGATSEDCLYLNVTTPSRANHRLPVMVFMHGGGFVSGAGTIYDPAPMVDQSGVIVVTPNYRLGPFGFLALPGLSAEGGAAKSGMYGFEDQQAALRWVRANIAAFGGDPHNMTVFGQSAGAASVCTHLVSPTSRGLFDKVAAQSGCILPSTTLATAESRGNGVAQRAGCTTGEVVACLRAKSTAEIEQAAPLSLTEGYGMVSGGADLPKPVSTLLAEGNFPKVPVLVGANHDEGRLLVAFGAFGSINASNYASIIQAQLGANAAAVLDQYPASAYATPALAYATVIGDNQFSCRTAKAAAVTSARTRLYLYEFNDRLSPSIIPAPPDFPLGVTHSNELPYLFNIGIALNADQQKSAARMIGYWARFAATGNPNGPNAAHWPPVGPVNPQALSLNADGARLLSVASFRTDHHCDLWDPIASP